MSLCVCLFACAHVSANEIVSCLTSRQIQFNQVSRLFPFIVKGKSILSINFIPLFLPDTLFSFSLALPRTLSFSFSFF